MPDQGLACYTAVSNSNKTFALNYAFLSNSINHLPIILVRHDKSVSFNAGLSVTVNIGGGGSGEIMFIVNGKWTGNGFV